MYIIRSILKALNISRLKFPSQTFHLSHCVTLGRLLTLSEPPFPAVYKMELLPTPSTSPVAFM
jgi:hypothetical protein